MKSLCGRINKSSQLSTLNNIVKFKLSSNCILNFSGASLPILRGTWFVDGTFQPLEYEYSLQLEQDHLAKFLGRPIPEPVADEKKSNKAEGTKVALCLYVHSL